MVRKMCPQARGTQNVPTQTRRPNRAGALQPDSPNSSRASDAQILHSSSSFREVIEVRPEEQKPLEKTKVKSDAESD